MEDYFVPLDFGIDEQPSWGTTPTQPAAQKRATRGVRQPNQPKQQAEASGEDEFGVEDWGDDWGAAAVEAQSPAGGPADAAAAGSSSPVAGASTFPERAGGIRNPWAAANNVSNQQKWDEVRPAMHRSYVSNLPGIHALRMELRAAQQAVMQQRLAAVQPCCNHCGSADMREGQPAAVLYVGTEARFVLLVPQYNCRQDGCHGSFSPSPVVVNCWPATAKVSWDVSLSSAAQPARWFDISMLQLADTLIFQGGRSVAVHTLAAGVHQQHKLNGCTDHLGFDHFKRQLAEAICVSALEPRFLEPARWTAS
jgi:hypothetical protein